MPLDPKRRHTEISAPIQGAVHTGRGDINVFGFAPQPTIPVNGSNLPHRFSSFVGRAKELQEVLRALASRAWIVAIDGRGGVGKTTLALEAAHVCKAGP